VSPPCSAACGFPVPFSCVLVGFANPHIPTHTYTQPQAQATPPHPTYIRTPTCLRAHKNAHLLRFTPAAFVRRWPLAEPSGHLHTKSKGWQWVLTKWEDRMGSQSARGEAEHTNDNEHRAREDGSGHTECSLKWSTKRKRIAASTERKRVSTEHVRMTMGNRARETGSGHRVGTFMFMRLHPAKGTASCVKAPCKDVVCVKAPCKSCVKAPCKGTASCVKFCEVA